MLPNPYPDRPLGDPERGYLLLLEDPQPSLFSDGRHYRLELRATRSTGTLEEGFGGAAYARLHRRMLALADSHNLEAWIGYPDGHEFPVHRNREFERFESAMLERYAKGSTDRLGTGRSKN